MEQSVIWPFGQQMTGFSERFWGLINYPEPNTAQAFWFPRCRSIHTFGMKGPIDVLGLDSALRVMRVERHVCPGRVRYFKRCHSILELASFSPWPLHSWVGQQLIFIRQGEPKYADKNQSNSSHFAIAVRHTDGRMSGDIS